LVSSSVGITST